MSANISPDGKILRIYGVNSTVGPLRVRFHLVDFPSVPSKVAAYVLKNASGREPELVFEPYSVTLLEFGFLTIWLAIVSAAALDRRGSQPGNMAGASRSLMPATSPGAHARCPSPRPPRVESCVRSFGVAEDEQRRRLDVSIKSEARGRCAHFKVCSPSPVR